MADASIIFKTDLDNKQLEKKLAQETRKVESMERKLAKKTLAKDQLAGQFKDAKQEALETLKNVERLNLELEASQSITDMKRGSVDPARYISELENQKRLREEIFEQERLLRQQDRAAEKLEKRYASSVDAVELQTKELNAQKESAAAVAAEIERMQSATGQMPAVMEGVEKRLDKLGARISGLAKRVLLFSVITSGLRSLRSWIWTVIQTNDEATDSIAQLKGALLTLAQPIVEVVVPAFITLVNILTRVISVIAQLLSFLFGKSFSQSKNAAKNLKAEAKALKGVGSAAEDAAGSLAGFDEINQITTENSGGSGGGNDSGIEPDFDFESALLGEDQLKNLLGLIEAIGSALLAWKIGSALGLGMKEILGLALGIFETIQFVKSMFDAWTNGVNWDNLLDMLIASAGMAAGFALAFGKIGAGISLIVSGFAMLATGFHDALENGWTLENTLLSIAGILETGMGIALLTGSWIPLLISGIAAALLALTIATGHGEELLDGVRDVLDGLRDFISGVFTGDIDKALAGVGQAFEGLNKIVDATFDGLCDTVSSFLDWLDEKTNGKLHGIIMTVKNFIVSYLNYIRAQLRVFVDAAEQMLEGIITFLSGVFTSDWNKAWDGVKRIFKGVWNGIVGLLENAINFIIRGLNFLIRQMNKISFDVPDWVPGIGGKSLGVNIPSISNVSIPRLATGAVVPPNREFLAMLGDNKTETEVVSPLSTMKQAFLEALQESGGASGGTIQVVLMLDGKELARNQVKHINNMTRAAGKPVILV